MGGPPDPPRGGRRQTAAVVVVAAVVFVVALVAALALAGEDDPSGYDDPGLRLDFVSACRSAAPDLPDGVCECTYDGLAAEVPFDAFVGLADQLRDGDAATPGTGTVGGTGAPGTAPSGTEVIADAAGEVPPELGRIIEACVGAARLEIRGTTPAAPPATDGS